MILTPLPTNDLHTNFGAWMLQPFSFSLCSPAYSVNPTSLTVPRPNPFFRVYVNYLIKSQATIYWELDRSFSDPGPYAFTAEFSHGTTPLADDWITVGTSTTLPYIIDTQGTKKQRLFGKTRDAIYRIRLTTPFGCYISPTATVLAQLNFHDHLLVQEILRKELLSHAVFSSNKSWLLKQRRYGTECPDCRCREVNSEFTDETWNTQCGTCLDTGYQNSYYPPVEFYVLKQPTVVREFRDMKTGTAKRVVIKGRMLGVLPLSQGDIIVEDGSDDRYYLHSITTAAQWKSQPIVYEAEMRLIPFTSPIYSIPIDKTYVRDKTKLPYPIVEGL